MLKILTIVILAVLYFFASLFTVVIIDVIKEKMFGTRLPIKQTTKNCGRLFCLGCLLFIFKYDGSVLLTVLAVLKIIAVILAAVIVITFMLAAIKRVRGL